MRWLIDGYNVMHAGGRLGPKLGREGFRRARRRFLDELADALGPSDARPDDRRLRCLGAPRRLPARCRPIAGSGVVFALGDENADARIEQLIADDSNPKTLTVVSSDHRIRQAAARRRARSLTADAVLGADRRSQGTAARRSREPCHRPAARSRPRRPAIDRASRPSGSRPSATSTRSPEIHEALAPNDSLLTDAEIAEIERQVEREGSDRAGSSRGCDRARLAHVDCARLARCDPW